MLARTATWTYPHDGELNLDWAGTYIYDGQGFLVSKKLGVKSAKELNGATICFTGGSPNELNLADYFRTPGMTYTPVVGTARAHNPQHPDAGRCDVFTNQGGRPAPSRPAHQPTDHTEVGRSSAKEMGVAYVKHTG